MSHSCSKSTLEAPGASDSSCTDLFGNHERRMHTTNDGQGPSWSGVHGRSHGKTERRHVDLECSSADLWTMTRASRICEPMVKWESEPLGSVRRAVFRYV